MVSISDKLYTAADCRVLDQTAIEQLNIPGYTLMNRAGNAVLEAARAAYPGSNSWLILCGAGNNGGDGYVIARLAMEFGIKMMVIALSDPARLTGDAATAWEAFQARGGEVHSWPAEIPDHVNLVIDAMLGTGLDRPVSGAYAEAIEAVNQLDCRRVAVDIPSGLHADTGVVMGCALRADLTVTFIGKKPGLFTADGPEHCGRLLFDRLEVPTAAYASVERPGHLLNRDYLSDLLPRRPRNSHKGSFGHVLVVAGATGMSGAARLAGEGALRSGAGLVTVATHPEHAAVLNIGRPELMVRGVANAPELQQAAERATVLALGPGLGTEAWGRALFAACRDDSRPLVLDADGLNLLAANPGQRDNWILTPHPAEAGRLLDCTSDDIQADRVRAALAIAERYGAVVILKGCGSIVAAPDGRWDICALGNPGMSTGGSGDVLTGVCAAMLAQGFEPWVAARLATLAHAAAGDRAAAEGERGLLPLDIARQLQTVVND
jgi:NAD(P)H-hydrate epimerase